VRNAEFPVASDRSLVEAHLGLVHQAVAPMAARVPSHVAWDDLVSAGMLGLTEAALAFDPGRSVPFECFAMTRIKGALLDELRRLDWASRSVRVRARAVSAATEVLAAELGRHPTTLELADRLGVDPSHLARVGDDLHRAAVVHYEALVAPDGACEDGLPPAGAQPETVVLERECWRELWDAVGALPERLRQVVVGSYLDERRLRDIADDLGVTESRVSQLRTEALAILRRGMREDAELDLRTEERPRRPHLAVA
jgi:RNA polymerase sigma factor for flagellar operon FliA